MNMLLSFFRMHFLESIQYRAAALGGVATQFFWGGMQLLLYRAFYRYNPEAFPMPFSALASYVWLHQALLMLSMISFSEVKILDHISDGGVVYELCRPVDLYATWYVRNLAMRCARVVLRMVPVLLVTSFLPAPYNLGPPASPLAFLQFLLALVLGAGVLVALTMLIYLSAFYTLSARGVLTLSTALVDALSGGLLPLPFLPEAVRTGLTLLPFAATRSTPYLLYVGYYEGPQIGWVLLLQGFWLAALVGLGQLWMRKALGRVQLQGG